MATAHVTTSEFRRIDKSEFFVSRTLILYDDTRYTRQHPIVKSYSDHFFALLIMCQVVKW